MLVVRLPIRSRDVVRLRWLIEIIYCIKCYLAIKSANELFLKLAIFLIYMNRLTFDQIHTRTVRKCDFDLLTEWFYPMFRNTIFTGQYLNQSIPRSVNIEITWSQYWLVNWWTGQYPILAYTTWRDLNQSQPHISTRCITIWGVDWFTGLPVNKCRNLTGWPVHQSSSSSSSIYLE